MNYSRVMRTVLPMALAAMLAACVAETVVYEPPPPRAMVSVTVAPPPLPVYEQPPCPEQGYLWMPGFWAHGPGGFYWVPGTWVEPPRVGYLWTPGYWGYSGAGFAFHEGYWGARVGYYGGINYGGGYGGAGYAGGRWVDNSFHYNTAVSNVNVTNVRNVYRETVTNNTTINNTTVNNTVSYSGGPGGVRATPSRAELEAERMPRVPPTPAQVQHRSDAGSNPTLQASHNQGRPPIAATPRPSAFTAPQATTARPNGPNAAHEAHPAAVIAPRHAAPTESPAHGAVVSPAAPAHERAQRALEETPQVRPAQPAAAKPAPSEETRHSGAVAGEAPPKAAEKARRAEGGAEPREAKAKPKDKEAEKEAERERNR